MENWFPGWVTRGSVISDTSSSNDPGSSRAKNLLSEEDQLLNELGYEARDNYFLRDRIFLTLNCSLTGGSFQLVRSSSSMTESFFGPEPLVEMSFKSLCFSTDIRPRLKYGSFEVSLGSLTVIDHFHSDSLFPVLVQPKDAKVKGK